MVKYNYKPDLSQNDYNQFLKTNRECLIFEIGGQKEGSLKESSISTITDNVETMKIWKTIIKEFKSGMLKGAWAVNPMNGAKEYYKEHRYTDKRAQRSLSIRLHSKRNLLAYMVSLGYKTYYKTLVLNNIDILNFLSYNMKI